jgi:hypothetical protein
VVTSKYPPRALLRDDRAVESVCADRLVNCADIALVYVAGVSFQRIDRNYGVFLTDRPRLILFPCFSRQVVRVETSGNPILGPLTSEFAPRSPLSAPKCGVGPKISLLFLPSLGSPFSSSPRAGCRCTSLGHARLARLIQSEPRVIQRLPWRAWVPRRIQHKQHTRSGRWYEVLWQAVSPAGRGSGAPYKTYASPLRAG